MSLITILAAIFQYALIGAVIYLLFRYGKLRKVTKIKYIYKHFGKQLSVRYRKFHGFDYYYFRLIKQEETILAYEVTVEEGSLTLEWRDSKNLLFTKTFTSDETGEFKFTPERRLHSVKLEAEHTRGGCKVEIN